MSATLGGASVKTAQINVPKRGRTRIEATLEGGAAAPSGKLTFAFANLSIVATVIPGRSGLDASFAPACVLLSGLGWDEPLPANLAACSWQSESGVPIRTVLDRLARIAGETLDPATVPGPAVILGQACALSAGTCAQALNALVLRGYLAPWWVNPEGKTCFGDRPTGVADPRTFEVARNDSMFGVRRLRLTSNASGLLPGNTVEGVPISRTEFTLTTRELTARTWA